jgi:hypothetical protein
MGNLNSLYFLDYGHDRSTCGLLAPGEVVLSRTRDGALSLRSLTWAPALEDRFGDRFYQNNP